MKGYYLHEKFCQQLAADKGTATQEDGKHPARKRQRRNAGEQRADVAAARKARAIAHQQAAQHGRHNLLKVFNLFKFKLRCQQHRQKRAENDAKIKP